MSDKADLIQRHPQVMDGSLSLASASREKVCDMRDRSTIKPKLSHGARGSLGSLSHTQLTGGSQVQRALEGSAMDRSRRHASLTQLGDRLRSLGGRKGRPPGHVKRILAELLQALRRGTKVCVDQAHLTLEISARLRGGSKGNAQANAGQLRGLGEVSARLGRSLHRRIHASAIAAQGIGGLRARCFDLRVRAQQAGRIADEYCADDLVGWHTAPYLVLAPPRGSRCEVTKTPRFVLPDCSICSRFSDSAAHA